MALTIATISIFLLNVPFGYWRNNVKKLSVQWFLSIHIPVPFIILMRLSTDIGFAWYSYIFTVAAFFLGQLAGKKIHKYMKEKALVYVGSNLVVDLIRNQRVEKG